MGDAKLTPPATCPAAYEGNVNKLNPDVRNLMIFYEIPWRIQSELAGDGFTTMADMSLRWPDQQSARGDSPKDYKFEEGSNNYSKIESTKTAIRVQQLHKAAGLRAQEADDMIQSTDTWEAQASLPTGQRAAMELSYMHKTGLTKPPLDEQGSDHYLALQYKQCARGEIGYFTNKQIISQLPDPEEAGAVQKKRKRDREGVVHEADEEQRYDPATLEQWKKQVMVF